MNKANQLADFFMMGMMNAKEFKKLPYIKTEF